MNYVYIILSQNIFLLDLIRNICVWYKVIYLLSQKNSLLEVIQLLSRRTWTGNPVLSDSRAHDFDQCAMFFTDTQMITVQNSQCNDRNIPINSKFFAVLSVLFMNLKCEHVCSTWVLVLELWNTEPEGLENCQILF